MTMNLLNAATGGAFMNKIEEAAFNLLKDMLTNKDDNGADRTIMRREAPSPNNYAIRAFSVRINQNVAPVQQAPPQ